MRERLDRDTMGHLPFISSPDRCPSGQRRAAHGKICAKWNLSCPELRVPAAFTRAQSDRKEHMITAKDTNVAPEKALQPDRHESVALSPFRTIERLADEVTRVFDDFGLGRGLGRVPASGEFVTWAPRVDVTRHNDELLIRVDLPGLDKNDVKVNIAEDAITIHGERHRAQEEERDGVYRTERNYGSFYRTIALPPGTVTDQAKASFKNGVLEIRIPAAPGAKGRPL